MIGERQQTITTWTPSQLDRRIFQDQTAQPQEGTRPGARGRTPLPLAQLEDHGKIHRLREKRRQDDRVSDRLGAQRRKNHHLHGSLFLVGKAGKTRITDEGALKRENRGDARPDFDEVLKLGQVYVHLKTHKIICGKNEIKLTPKEYELLCVLLKSSGRILTFKKGRIHTEVYRN